MGKEKSNKATILIFNEYYLPGYKAGGPIRSVSNLVSWLGDEFNFKIITKDRDSFENEPYEGIKVNEWNKIGNAEVYYIAEKDLDYRQYFRILKQIDYDAIYFNSVFNIWFSIIPLFLSILVMKVDPSKILLIPRGELSKGALDQKTFKKKMFLWLSNVIGIYKRIKWQATNEEEKKEIQQIVNIPDDQIHIASNLPQKISNKELNRVKKAEGSLKIVYLSRITPKKNLDFALELLSNIDKIEISYDLYGIIDDLKYWESCKVKINNLPPNINVDYKGVISHQKVISKLSEYHLFLLPTKGENFGHAIYESMLAGTPVLISDKTPWIELSKKGLGWSFSLSEKRKFIRVIRELGETGNEQINERKKEVRKNILKLDLDKTVSNNRDLFEHLIR